jgi:integrase
MKGIQERSGSYQAKRYYSQLGKRVTGTFPSKELAVSFLAACDLAIVQGKPMPDPKAFGNTRANKTATLADLLHECTAHDWAENRSSASVDNARQFADWAGKSLPIREAFTPAKLQDYVRFRKTEKRNAGKTVNKKMSAVLVMQKRAVFMGLIDGVVPLKRQKEKTGHERYWTVEEENAIREVTKSLALDEWADFWDFLCNVGARPGEARQLRWEHFRSGAVTIYATKNTSKETRVRTIDLNPIAMAAVKRRRDDPRYASAPGPFSFAAREKSRQVWDKLRAYIPWIEGAETVPYTYRHTFASRLAMAGTDIRILQRLLGHTSITMTEKYMHLSPFATRGATMALVDFKDPGLE